MTFVAISYLTLVPRPLPEVDIPLFPGADKVVHALMILCLTGAMGLDRMRHSRDIDAPRVRLGGYALLAAAYGGLIELLQGWMDNGRGEDVYDFLADVIGAAIGWMVCVWWWGAVRRCLIGK